MRPQNDCCQLYVRDYLTGKKRKCGRAVDPALADLGEFCTEGHAGIGQDLLRRANHSRRYRTRRPSAGCLRNAFDGLNSALSEQGIFNFSVHMWWRVELPHTARERFEKIIPLIPHLDHAKELAQDLQDYFHLSRKPSVIADYAIVITDSLSVVLPQLGCEPPLELEEMISKGEQPLFSGHVVFHEDSKTLLNAYRALLREPERRMREVELHITI